MTLTTFKKHKWKPNEKVWVITTKEYPLFTISSYRVVDALIATCEIIDAGICKHLTQINLIRPGLEDGEKLKCGNEVSIFDPKKHYAYVFTSKKKAVEYLEKAQKLEDVQYRAKRCLDFYKNLYESIKSIAENGL